MSNIPLNGYLATENDKEIHVYVRGGTWIISRSHIESLSDWKDAPTEPHTGRAVEVTVKPGSELGFLRTVTVHPLERPLTLPEHYAKLAGNKDLAVMAQQWGLQHGFKVIEPLAFGPHDTVSCWDDPSGWGTVCSADDCGYPTLK